MWHPRLGPLVLLLFLIGVDDSNANHHEPNFKTLDSLAVLLKGFDATDAKAHDLAIGLFSRVIAAANLSANHLSTAYRARGDAYFQKGNSDSAIGDYERAIELTPHNTSAYINRGNVFLHRGKLGRAMKDLNAAIALDPHEALAFQNRGNTHFFRGHFDMAATDYRRSLGLEPSDLFSVIWLYIATSRSGGGGRADLLAQSLNKKLDEWPGPVVSLYLDDVSVNELVEIANRHAGPEKAELLSEAYFYGGEYHLLRQESEEAAEMLRRVIAQGASNLVEFIGAKVELARMKR